VLPVDGYVVIDGLYVGVAGMELAGGQMTLRCQKRGPLPASDGTPKLATVYGGDGVRVCEGRVGASWREVGEDEVLDFKVELKMTECRGDAEEAPGGQGS
jgi:hypothetical protein